MFDLDRIKKESNIKPEDLARLEARIRRDFPEDEMMYELHLLRVVQAIRQGWVTLEDALAEEVEV